MKSCFLFQLLKEVTLCPYPADTRREARAKGERGGGRNHVTYRKTSNDVLELPERQETKQESWKLTSGWNSHNVMLVLASRMRECGCLMPARGQLPHPAAAM